MSQIVKAEAEGKFVCHALYADKAIPQGAIALGGTCNVFLCHEEVDRDIKHVEFEAKLQHPQGG